jgi:hypothetical protein
MNQEYLTLSIDIGTNCRTVTRSVDELPGGQEEVGVRCPGCRTKIVIRGSDEVVVKNAILRVSLRTGHAAAKCPRCKTWVEVPLRYAQS